MAKRVGWWMAVGAVGLALALTSVGVSGEHPKHKHVGVKSCAKMCHKSATRGKQLAVWEKTDHAKAYKTLLGEEAKKVAAKVGLKDEPHKSLKCLKCHATASDVPKELHSDSFSIEDGVQCEACHGPGEKYKTMSAMKDPAKAKKLGRVTGDEKTCLTCHNDTSPTWDPERHTTKDGKKVGFDYELLWPKIAHPMPEKK